MLASVCYHTVTGDSLQKAPRLHPPLTRQPSLWESPDYWEHMQRRGGDRGAEIALRVFGEGRVIKTSQGFLAVLPAFHRQREPDELVFWAASVLTFLRQQAAFKAPRCQSGNQNYMCQQGPVSATFISFVPHLLHISEANSEKSSIKVCARRLDNPSLSLNLSSEIVCSQMETKRELIILDDVQVIVLTEH